jgi:hypothetical protein
MSDEDHDHLAVEQYVYVYRNKASTPIYVGRGKRTARSLVHLTDRAHNDDLSAALKQNPDFTVEISGPF